MKLHLPKMLTAALFAAFISFTQASGTTIKDAVLTLTDFTQDSITAANQAGWTLTNVTPSDDGIFTSTTNQAYITKSTAWTVTTGSGNTARTPWSAILTINIDDFTTGTGVLIESAKNPQQAVGARYEGIAYDASGNQTLKGAWTGGVWDNLIVTTDLKSYADEDGNVTVGIVYKDGNNGTTIFVGDGNTWKSNGSLRSGNDCAGNPTIFLGDKAGVEYSSLYLFGGVVSDNDMKAMLSSLMHGAVTWTGAKGAAWDTATQNWVETGTETPATFSQGASVTFGADAAVKSVTVGVNITAGAMSVSDDYTFTVADGATLTLAGIDVASGKTATFTSQGTISGSITKSGAGTVSITDDGLALSGITVSAGKVVVDGVTSGDVGTITAAAPGTVISVSHATATVQGGYQGDLEIRDGGYVTAATTDGWDYGKTHSLTVYTGGTLDFGTTRWTINSSNTITLAGGTITGVGQDSYGAIDFNQANTLHVTEDSTLAARLRLRADTTIDVANGKKLNFTGAFGDKNGKFIKAGQGSMTMSADNSHYTGTIQLDAGTLTVTGANALGTGAIAQNGGVLEIGAAVNLGTRLTQTAGSISVLEGGNLTLGGLTLANAIANAGTLTLTGNYDINALASTGETTYDNGGSQDIAEGNGFQRTTGVVHVVTGGGTLSADTATFTHGAEQRTGLDANGDFVLQGTTDYSVLYVNNNNGVSYNAAWEVAQSQTTPATITSVVMAADTTLTADKADASFALTVNGNATVDATEATTISGISGWSNNTLTVTGDGAVTLPSGTLTLSGTTKLDVQGTATTNKIELNSDAASLVVGATGDLTISGDNNLTVTKGTVDISGKVYVGHEIDLSNGSKSTGKITLHEGADVTVKDGMWMNHTSAGILLEEGAKLAITGKSVKFTGKEDGSIKVAVGKQMNYNVGNTDALISNVIMEALGNITIANQLDNVDVVTGAHTVTLNTDADSVTVSDGGTFTKGDSATVNNIFVEGRGTIAGDNVEIDEVTINEGATATFADQAFIGSVDEAVYLYSINTPIVIHNGGEEAAKYIDLHQEGMEVFAETLSSAAIDVTVENTVAVGAIVHQGAGSLTLAHVNTEPLDAVEVTNGSLIMQDVEATILSSMKIASGTTVAVYTDATAEVEGTVTINDTLTAGGGTLLANLTLVSDSTLDLSLMDGGMQALTLGSTLTFDFSGGSGSHVNLDEATIAALSQLQDGGKLDLIVAKDQTELTYGGNGYNGMSYDDLFVRTEALTGAYTVYANGAAFGLMKSTSPIPEPTTGTLSLLALMALAARRRRK